MVNFKEGFYSGIIFSHIQGEIKNLQHLFSGVLLTSLMYETKEDEIKKKTEFYNHSKKHISKVNTLIRGFNGNAKIYIPFMNCVKIELIDTKKVKRIIDEHKGDYKMNRVEGRLSPPENIVEYITGTGSDASSLSKRNTHMKLLNVLIPTINSMDQLFKRFKEYSLFFGEIDKIQVRDETKKFITEASDVYSIGLFGISVFIIGKTLEKSITDYLFVLQNLNKIDYKTSEIVSWDFDTKINILKKEKFITDPQYSKMMSVKCDRNIFGHPTDSEDSKQAEKDTGAIIKIGLNAIILIENKIHNIVKNSE